jgi:hypothetical protein
MKATIARKISRTTRATSIMLVWATCRVPFGLIPVMAAIAATMAAAINHVYQVIPRHASRFAPLGCELDLMEKYQKLFLKKWESTYRLSRNIKTNMLGKYPIEATTFVLRLLPRVIIQKADALVPRKHASVIGET